MNWLRKVILGLLLLPTGLVLVSLFLPASYQVERNTSIRAAPGAIYPHLSRARQWPAWSPWTQEKDPGLTVTFTGPAEGAGSILRWEGKKMGTGTMTLASADPSAGIRYDLSVENGRFQSHGAVLLVAVPGGTEITWTDEGELGWNPVNRFFGLLADGMIGRDLEQGLTRLKVLVESKQAQAQ